MASIAEPEWTNDAIGMIAQQPVVERRKTLPEKWSYGSNFPLRDVGQLEGVRAVGGANRSVVSGAYGGFSNLWGAQIMPFSAATFDRWPFGRHEMDHHYRIALNEMTFTGDEDDLVHLVPPFDNPSPAAEALRANAESARSLRSEASGGAIAWHHHWQSQISDEIKGLQPLWTLHDGMSVRPDLLSFTHV